MSRNTFHCYVKIVVLMMSIIKLSKSDECEDIDFLSDAASRRSAGENTLLNGIYSSLSIYEIQNYRNEFNIESIDNWWNKQISQKLDLTRQNLAKVMKRIETLKIVDVGYPEDVILTKSEVQKLIHVLDLTLYKNVTLDCSDEQVLIYGHFISLKGIKKLRKVHNNCERMSLNRTRSLAFFSVDTIFIDADFNINDESFESVKEVSFVAPKFQVIGNRRFNFDALDTDPSMSFFGLADSIEDRQNLVITAKNGDVALFDLMQESDEIDGKIFIKDRENKTVIFNDVSSKAKLLNEYRVFFRKNFATKHREFYNLDFFDRLNRVVNFYDFSNLEEPFWELKNLISKSVGSDSDVTLFYEHLLRRINIYYSSTVETSKNTDDLYLLKYLYAATLSVKNHFKENFLMGLIMNVPEHFESLLRDFKDLDEKEKKQDQLGLKSKIREDILGRIKNFDDSVNAEIKSANETITNKVKEELENLNRELNVSLSNLSEEIEKKLTKTRNASRVLEEERDNILKDACVQSALGVLKIAAVGLSFAGPIGIAAGAAISAGVMVSEAVSQTDKDKRDEQLQKIGSDLTDNVKTLQSQMEAKKERELDILEDSVEKVRKETSSAGLEENVKKEKISFLKSRKEDIKKLKADIKNVSFDRIKGFKKELFQKFKTKFMDSEAMRKMSTSLEKFSTIANTGSFAMDIYNTWTNYAQSKDKLKNSLEANSVVLDGLKKFKESINTDIMPDLEKLVNKISGATKKIVNESKVDFSLDKFDIEKIFAKTRNYLDKIIDKSYDMKDSLMKTIDKLEKLLPILLSTNSIVQDFKQQKNLADLMADINYSQMSNLRKYENIIAEIDVIVHSAILINEYKVAHHALEQYLFPFTDGVIDEFDDPEQFQINSNKSVSDIKNRVEKISRKLTQKKKQYLSGNMGNRISEMYFGKKKGAGSRRPFFVWEHEEYGDLISKLLKGNEVYLYADITKRETQYDVIKMKNVEFFFKSRRREKKLTSVLRNFTITFTHLGNSYYTLNKETYMIKTAQIIFEYPFNEKVDEVTTGNYGKLRKGDYMLSPYTIWKVQLDKGEYGDFRDLRNFEGDVDLELKGKGSHVKRGYTVKNVMNYESVKLCKHINESLLHSGL